MNYFFSILNVSDTQIFQEDILELETLQKQTFSAVRAVLVHKNYSIYILVQNACDCRAYYPTNNDFDFILH